MALQTLDFGRFLNGHDSERKQLADDLVESFKRHGFAKLVNYGIADEKIRDLFALSTKLFALPIEVKKAMANPKGHSPQRGWSGYGDETTAYLHEKRLREGVAPDLTDEKELFDCSSRHDAKFPNKWPGEHVLDEFRPFVEQAYDDYQHTSLQIMEAIEMGLSLPRGTLANRCQNPASELRLAHYPTVALSKLQTGKASRVWPHADYNVFTLVFQDSVGGLEMEDRSNPGTFVPIPPNAAGAPMEVAINVSEILQRWSNDLIIAGVHRVAPPSDLDDTVVPERNSQVFFFNASSDTLVGSLPEFVTEENPAKYDDVTTLQYQMDKGKLLTSLLLDSQSG